MDRLVVIIIARGGVQLKKTMMYLLDEVEDQSDDGLQLDLFDLLASCH